MLETKWLYLILNAFTISVPFIRSFEQRVAYYKSFGSLFKAMSIVSTFFILWDVYFTEIGVWGFNPLYLSGWEMFGLPLGEYLFFITVPYSCIFIYKCLEYFFPKGILSEGSAKSVSVVLLVMTTSLAVYGIVLGKWYTASTFVLLTVTIAYVQFAARPVWLPRFYESYSIAIVPFFIKNGILTGSFLKEQVVWYNDAHNIGIRLGTIPFEDVFYGMLLILGILFFYEKFEAARKGRLNARV